MAATAATLWGINGAVSKVVLESGISSLRLVQVRSAGAFVGLVLAVALTAPERLRVRRRELAFLAAFGMALALVQWFYFLAIKRLALGIALLLQYLGPLFVAVWARYVYHEPVRRRIWLALGLALLGLGLIVGVRGGGRVSAVGVAFGLAAAVAYTLYVLLAEREVGRRDALSLLAWGFLFASVFWAVLARWWSFPFDRSNDSVSLLGRLDSWHLPVWALMALVVVPGTIVPFFLLVSALRQLSATRVGIIAMLEPVTATIVGWAWLGETLNAEQLAGAVVVLAAIVLAQTAR
jgi:drug/metabolite transporter (DMT)-like permease